MKGRAKLRGKPLEWFCQSASTSKKEFGENDTRCLCYGLIDMDTGKLLKECAGCGAYAFNVKAPAGEM